MSKGLDKPVGLLVKALCIGIVLTAVSGLIQYTTVRNVSEFSDFDPGQTMCQNVGSQFIIYTTHGFPLKYLETYHNNCGNDFPSKLHPLELVGNITIYSLLTVIVLQMISLRRGRNITKGTKRKDNKRV